jgi:hypothetical protein
MPLHLFEDPDSNASKDSNGSRLGQKDNNNLSYKDSSCTPTQKYKCVTCGDCRRNEQLQESVDESQENLLPLVIPDQSRWLLNDIRYYQKIINLWE